MEQAFGTEIGEIAAGLKPGRQSDSEITFFKTVGIAVEDAAVAARVVASAEAKGLGSLVDELYKKTVRPDLVSPCFITNHTADMLPLARRNDEDPRLVDSFQLVIAGWEVLKAYSELVDPVDQRARMVSLDAFKTGGVDLLVCSDVAARGETAVETNPPADSFTCVPHPTQSRR